MPEFLLEIGTEEIPARFLKKIENDLGKAVAALLTESGLRFQALSVYTAPRQITVFSRDIEAGQADRVDTIMGPPVRIAYDENGKPGKALLGFLRKNPALTEADLFRIDQPKGEIVAGKISVIGRKTIEILAESLPTIFGNLHFPKNMRWGHCQTRFVRPVRGLVALFGGEVIPFSFADIRAGRRSFGHRQFKQADFEATTIDAYLAQKERSGIIVRHEDRLNRIQTQLQARLESIEGVLVPDPDLLQEVADLVELPYVVLGGFDPMFLDIPKEVLTTSMRDHQKSFSVQDASGALMPFFLSIANVAGDEKGLIRKGNEWVLNARLWDAKFFWESDLKKDYNALREKLRNLVFQTKIGSYFEKTERLIGLAGYMADQLAWTPDRKKDLAEAARHCKTDLVSELVFEFPELQGVAGGLILGRKGRPDAVARAIYDHYLPVAMDGDLPTTLEGALISVADKLDTLTGCFGVGIVPKGAKDPFALRRAAQGIVRVLIEHDLPFSLEGLLEQAIAGYQNVISIDAELKTKIFDFFVDRMRYYLKLKGFEHDLANAVLARDTDRVDQTLKRAQAIRDQQGKDHFRALALNLKRMNNMIADEAEHLPVFDPEKLSEEPERLLYRRHHELKPEIETAASARNYNRAMDLMTELADPIETYFGPGGVLVNVEDDAIRLNRKAMIHEIRLTLGLVADISCLE